MNEWIDFVALAKVVIGGLICGAGLPALFALGLRALHTGAAAPAMAGGVDGTGAAAADDDELVGGSKAGLVVATVCFLVVLGAVVWGIYLIAAA